VTGCEITGGIRVPSLDTATCRILRARDAAGHPVQGAHNGRVHWRLPD
jgi:hypothetical protein